MSTADRDRDEQGRPRSARPRDALGRPLPYGSPAAAVDDEVGRLEAERDPRRLLAGAQQLLDAGRPFEAHEVLEGAWKHAAPPERDLWRALAQLAVAVTHRLRGNAAGAQTLAGRAADVLDGWADAAPHGIDAAGLAERARLIEAGEPVQRLRLQR